MNYKINIETKHKFAFDANDYLHPLGAINDNATNPEFIQDIEKTFPERPLHFLDLGCAGGALVQDVLRRGHIAVGLDGTDCNVKLKRAAWPKLYLSNLFTCDISQEYTIQIQQGDGEKQMMLFDAISAWEVLEHIPTERLSLFFENVRKHLKIGGHFYAGICQAGSEHRGYVYHHSVFKKDVWKSRILNFLPGLKLHDYPYPERRAVHYEPNNSFYIMLERVDF
jgi:SAM-dependent methyltransferase